MKTPYLFCLENGHDHGPDGWLYGCTREEVAYRAQIKWNKMMRRLLAQEGPAPLPVRISDDAWARKASAAGAEHWALYKDVLR